MNNRFYIPLSAFHIYLPGLCSLLFVATGATAAASDSWPQFRGADGDGSSPATGLPTAWSETRNIRWKTALPGAGYSSPVIQHDHIWLTAAVDGGHSRNVLTVDFQTGELIRNQPLFKVDALEKIHKDNSYATPTPVLDGDRVYLTFGAPGTACLSAKTGAVIWQRTDFKVLYHDVGAASSPLIYKDKLILICDGDNTSERFVTALDKMTGRTLWRTDRTFQEKYRTQMVHSSCIPHVITVAGRDQLICPGGRSASAYDPQSGRELWRVEYESWSVVPRPLYADGLLYICAGVIKPIMLCIDPVNAQGDITGSPHIIWETTRKVPDMPSPLFINHRFYTLTSSKLACREPKSGEIIQEISLPGQHLASPVYADGHIYLFNRTGGAAVVKAADEFQLVSTNTLASGCMASPAIYGRSLIVRTTTHLYRIEKSEE